MRYSLIYWKIKRACSYFVFIFRKDGTSARILGSKIGVNTRIFTPYFGSEPELIQIGKNCTITDGVKFITHDGSGSLVYNEMGERYYRHDNIKIGDNVFIGSNSILLPGVEIVSNVIIGAGSVVTKSINVSGVYAGVPAKFLKKFEDFEQNVRANWSVK